ncbi:hypothetical protein EON64_11635, partial [archaeon]
MYAAFTSGADAQFSSDSDDEKQVGCEAPMQTAGVHASSPRCSEPSLNFPVSSHNSISAAGVRTDRGEELSTHQEHIASRIGGVFGELHTAHYPPNLPSEEFYDAHEPSTHLPGDFNDSTPSGAREHHTYNYPPGYDSYRSSYDYNISNRSNRVQQAPFVHMPERYAISYVDGHSLGYDSTEPFDDQRIGRGRFVDEVAADRSGWYQEGHHPHDVLYTQQGAYRGEVFNPPSEAYVDDRVYMDQREYAQNNSFFEPQIIQSNEPYPSRHVQQYSNQLQGTLYVCAEQQYLVENQIPYDENLQWSSDVNYSSSGFAPPFLSDVQEFGVGLPAQQANLVVSFDPSPPQLALPVDNVQHMSWAPRRGQQRQEGMPASQPAQGNALHGNSLGWQPPVLAVPPPILPPPLQTHFPGVSSQLEPTQSGGKMASKIEEYKKAQASAQTALPTHQYQEKSAAVTRVTNAGIASTAAEVDMQHWSKNHRRRWRRQQMKLAQQQNIGEIDKGMQLIGAVVHGVDKKIESHGDLPSTLSVPPVHTRLNEKLPVSNAAHSGSVVGQKRTVTMVSRQDAYDAQKEPSNESDDGDFSIDNVRQPGDDEDMDNMAVEGMYGQLGYSDEVIDAIKRPKKKASNRKKESIRSAKMKKQMSVSAPLLF